MNVQSVDKRMFWFFPHSSFRRTDQSSGTPTPTECFVYRRLVARRADQFFFVAVFSPIWPQFNSLNYGRLKENDALFIFSRLFHLSHDIIATAKASEEQLNRVDCVMRFLWISDCAHKQNSLLCNLVVGLVWHSRGAVCSESSGKVEITASQINM